MYDKAELCEKIRSIYPDIGECGIDIDVNYDQDQKSWVVYLKKDKGTPILDGNAMEMNSDTQ